MTGKSIIRRLAGNDYHWKDISNHLCDDITPSELDYQEKVGVGSTAEVFRAYWRGQEVAVKEINLNGQDAHDSLKVRMWKETSFVRELTVLSKACHPNLVRLLGVCLKDPSVRLMMEYCQGGSVFELVHNAEDLGVTLAQQLKMCKDTAQGMHYLHNFKPQIIHRDLKSLNLLLSTKVQSRTDVPFVKVTDFGTARFKEVDNDWWTLTRAVGTFQWMAPEVLQGTYDEMADVYSYAMVLYEILSREMPFEEEEEEGADVMYLVKTGHRPDLELVPPDCPAVLTNLMICCWADSPRKRPTFQEILAVLAGIELQGGCKFLS